MGLLKLAENTTAFLKLGIQGFEGSGKTHLASEFAKGLTKLVKGNKVAFFDTEKGSDFHIKRFKAEGLELHVIKSRSFLDLISVIKESEENGYSFLIIDSITHVWRELTAAYMRKRNKSRLTMQDWVVLKTEWQQFTHLYVNSKVHIAMCGRAGYTYDFDEDEDGKKEIIKSGTKMKAEGETGFEPDLLIETYTVPIAETLNDKKAKKNAKGFINRCVVIKDRSDTINSQIFEEPTFKDFSSVIEFINLGGMHEGTDETRTSDALIDTPDRSWAERGKLVEITLEQIKETFILNDLDGTSADAKKRRTQLLIDCFGTSAWTAIESKKLEDLKSGLETLKSVFQLKEVANG